MMECRARGMDDVRHAAANAAPCFLWHANAAHFHPVDMQFAEMRAATAKDVRQTMQPDLHLGDRFVVEAARE